MRVYLKGLQHNITLLHLNLSNNAGIATTNPDTVRSLTKMLHVNQSLTHLDLSHNEISNSGAHCIFQHNTTLVNLNLSKTDITATNHATIARSLNKMLQLNKSLTHLDLSENSVILDTGAYSIFDGLQHNTTLVNLNLLSKTGIAATNPAVARSLTKLLQVNKSLTHLDLSENNAISDTGAYFIFDGLQHNTTLVNLNLSKTGIAATNPATARSLTNMLYVNKSLTHLDLSYCFMDAVSHRIISLIFEGLEHNTTLRYLDLHVGSSVVYIHADTVAKHIAQALKSNCSLQTLNIAGWMLLGNGVHIFLQSLMSNSTLQTLYVTYMYIDRETLSAFKKAREDKNLPPIDIHPYSSWESEFKLELESELESDFESESELEFELESESD